MIGKNLSRNQKYLAAVFIAVVLLAGALYLFNLDIYGMFVGSPKIECPAGYTYDSNMQICKVECSKGEIFKNGKCISICMDGFVYNLEYERCVPV